MEGESILQTIAEISVAFAGFTGVVAAFGRGTSGWSVGDRLRFRVMLATSLAALLFSLLPFLLDHLGVGAGGLWRTSSAMLAVYLFASSVFDVRLFRIGRAASESTDPPSVAVGVSVGVLALGTALVQALNALAVGLGGTFGVYLLGLAVLLVLSSLMFVRLLSFVVRDA